MNDRLTQKDADGFWCVKGIPWKNLYTGTVVARETNERLYGALRKLLDYEEIGPTPRQLEMVDKMYLEKCQEVNRLQKENDHLMQTLEAIGKTVFKVL